MTSKKPIDWEAVEIQYRAGIRSLKDIGGEFGVSDAAIIKRARRDSWVRDLKAKIHARAEAKVSASVVSAEVSARTKVNERDTIEKMSDEIANVRLGHRKDVNRARGLANKLLYELEGLTDNRDLFAELGALLRSEDDKGQDRRNDLYQKVIDLPSRSKTMKEMSDTLKTLITLEREAYDIAPHAAKLDLTNSDGTLKPQAVDTSKLSTETLRELLEAKSSNQE